MSKVGSGLGVVAITGGVILGISGCSNNESSKPTDSTISQSKVAVTPEGNDVENTETSSTKKLPEGVNFKLGSGKTQKFDFQGGTTCILVAESVNSSDLFTSLFSSLSDSGYKLNATSLDLENYIKNSSSGTPITVSSKYEEPGQGKLTISVVDWNTSSDCVEETNSLYVIGDVENTSYNGVIDIDYNGVEDPENAFTLVDADKYGKAQD